MFPIIFIPQYPTKIHNNAKHNTRSIPNHSDLFFTYKTWNTFLNKPARYDPFILNVTNTKSNSMRNRPETNSLFRIIAYLKIYPNLSFRMWQTNPKYISENSREMWASHFLQSHTQNIFPKTQIRYVLFISDVTHPKYIYKHSYEICTLHFLHEEPKMYSLKSTWDIIWPFVQTQTHYIFIYFWKFTWDVTQSC